MYVNQGKALDYPSFLRLETETKEQQELERLRRLYTKTRSPSEDSNANGNLQLFFKNITSDYTASISIGGNIPRQMQARLQADLDSFKTGMAAELTQSTLKNFDSIKTFPHSARDMLSTVSDSAVRLGNILEQADSEFRSYNALVNCGEYHKFIFICEQGESSCTKCHSLHGKLFSTDELGAGGIIPPLHPNCKCRLIAVDNMAERLYNTNQEGFLRQLEQILNDLSPGLHGGIYVLDHSFFRSGITSQTLYPLQPAPFPSITDGTHNEANWFRGIKTWAVTFFDDFIATVDAFFQRGQQLLVRADDTLNENFLLGIVYWADALSLGIVSGMVEGLQQNYEKYRTEPNLQNFLNYWTLGLVDMLNGAIFPKEPLSFENVMNIIGVAGLLTGAAKIIQNFSKNSLDDAARAAIGQLDDTIDAAARKNGKIVKVSSADDINAAHLKLNPTHAAPYTPGTKVYTIKYNGNTKFVRVYIEDDFMAREWIMNADDIVGLTAQQIKDKYSLLEIPTKICDVNVPIGTNIQVSSVNGILGNSGGGVQFRLSNYKNNWFTNPTLIG